MSAQEHTSMRLYVGGLPYQTTERDLIDLFEQVRHVSANHQEAEGSREENGALTRASGANDTNFRRPVARKLPEKRSEHTASSSASRVFFVFTLLHKLLDH